MWEDRRSPPDAGAARPWEARAGARRSPFCGLQYRIRGAWAELAAMPAVRPVDAHADNEPCEEAQPGQNRQPRHQQYTEDHAENGRGQASGSAEPAMPLRLLVTQDDDAER